VESSPAAGRGGRAVPAGGCAALARQAFTAGVPLSTGDDLVRYFERPVSFLSDVLRQLQPGSRAALACVYLSGDELAAPVQFTSALTEAVTRLGATERDVLSAFPTLDNTFLQQTADTHGDPVWRFRHPTIREGFAAVVAEDVNAVTVFLDGLDDDELLQQIDCGGARVRGTLVRVPASLYPRVLPRVVIPMERGPSWLNPFAVFLTGRCSPAFLRAWSAEHSRDLDRLLRFGGYLSAYWQPRVLGRLQEAGALPEPIRRAAVRKIEDLAIELLEVEWLDEPVSRLLTPLEREELLERIREEILPDINYHIDLTAEGYESKVEPSERYDQAKTALAAYKRAFAGDARIMNLLAGAEAYAEEAIHYAVQDYEPPPSPRLAERPVRRPAMEGGRDEFDDLAQAE
jgi:hypothetical protein